MDELILVLIYCKFFGVFDSFKTALLRTQ